MPRETITKTIPRTLVFASLLFAPFIASGAVTNFATGFESAESYASGTGLAGQQSWIGYVVATNLSYISANAEGNGVISGGLGGSGQAAYVGLTPLPPAYDREVELLRFYNLNPNGSGLPMVNFSTRVKITDSTNGLFDYFYWDFYNTNSDFLFGIEFNNTPLRISHVNSTNKVVKMSNYLNAVEYTLGVSMNFASNRYSVTWNGVLLTNNLPITITGAALNLGSIATVWQPSDRANPGDNYMLFDDVRLVSAALIPPNPQLKVLTPGGSGAATLRLTGQDGFRFAVDGSTNLVTWLAVGTNIVSGGTADYTDSAASGKSARYYRARWVP